MIRKFARSATAAVLLAVSAAALPQPALADGLFDGFSITVTPKGKDAAVVRKALTVTSKVHGLNSATVRQNGVNNAAGVRQSGTGNVTGVFQAGKNNTAVTAQNGNNNALGVVQLGKGRTANVTQNGNNKTQLVFQAGW